MDIAEATEDDLPAIQALQAAAFEASDYGHQGEADLVAELIDDGDAVLSLCAWDKGTLIGHALFSRMKVSADGRGLNAVGLGPVATAPDRQRRGVAAALIEHGHRMLARQGVEIAFVLGDPGYYPRFGYSADLAARFRCAYACEALMARFLQPGLDAPARGKARYAAAFDRMD